MKMKLLVFCILGWFWNFNLYPCFVELFTGELIWYADHGGTKEQAPIWLVEFIKIQKKSDFSPTKFQLVGDVIGCCRSLVRLSVIFTGIYVSVTFLSPFCHRLALMSVTILLFRTKTC